ncbi:hypothetical protein [Acetobacterium wieringae]|uniref:hypothetical protein n=1 Tax=Acetobacterium wieringae TaxID=52694 RepID=UPI0020332BC9|nr:hypothetical protein [Acetobacterium wieringae]URN83954.1 hypothetical protein CHL1_003118 [Acetobacterium wieringae]
MKKEDGWVAECTFGTIFQMLNIGIRIKKDSKAEEFKILKGNLIIENMLDLTDLDICKSVSLLWDFLKNKLIKDHPELENSLNKAESGKKLNLIFLHIETYKLNYEVIKCAARYPKTPKSNLFEYHFDGNKNNFCEVTTENKIIYNAKTEKCLFEFSEEIIEV